jgi:hypothetical protein
MPTNDKARTSAGECQQLIFFRAVHGKFVKKERKEGKPSRPPCHVVRWRSVGLASSSYHSGSINSSKMCEPSSSSSRPTKEKSASFSPTMIAQLLRDELRQELPRLAVGSAALLLSALSNQAFPRLMGRLIDNEASLSWTLSFVVLGGGVASLVRTVAFQTARHALVRAWPMRW